jgi:alkylation response protein AidB-like acyl-CoA dehydrogenase
MSAARETASRPDPVARARALAPAIAAAADRIEQGREIPADLLDALHEAALFRTLLPRSLGGDETRPATFVRMMEVIAAADASTAWCIGQTSGCSMAAAYMDPAAARRIWGDDPRAALAWGAGPHGTARPVEGGYVVSGRWQFASGGRHATWLGGHSRIVEPDGSVRRWTDGPLAGQAIERSMLFPRSAVRMESDWNAMGLRGTGSDSYSVSDVFVPEHHTVTRDHAPERRERGTLYRFATTQIYAGGFAAVALGIAQAMLDAFAVLAADKTPRGAARMLRDSHAVQAEMAVASAKVAAARSFLLTTLEETWEAVAPGGELTLEQRMRIRLAATFASQQAREAADFAYHTAGATAIFPANGFERRFRDIHTVSQQVQARASHFETVGAHLLGLSPPLAFV